MVWDHQGEWLYLAGIERRSVIDDMRRAAFGRLKGE